VHPGHDWFFVLSGAVRLGLGDRTIIVGEGEAAEFSTMTPHSIAAHEQTTELITIFDRTGHDAHARPHDH
jgi:quercetin dioxygenase-like cupin family protein